VAFLLVMLTLGMMAYVLPGAAIYVFAAGGPGTASASFNGSMGGWSGVTVTGIAVSLSMIDSNNTADPADDTWTINASEMNFSPLTYDAVWDVYRCRYYYAIDVGTNGVGPWTITHTVGGSFARSSPVGVGDHIVATVVKQTGDHTADAGFTKTGLDANSRAILPALNGMAFNNREFSGGWLRIYYGIYGGADPVADPKNYTAGAEPITNGEGTPSEGSNGTIMLTLTQ